MIIIVYSGVLICPCTFLPDNTKIHASAGHWPDMTAKTDWLERRAAHNTALSTETCLSRIYFSRMIKIIFYLLLFLLIRFAQEEFQ